MSRIQSIIRECTEAFICRSLWRFVMNVDFIPESWGWKQEFFSAWNAAAVDEKEFSAQKDGAAPDAESVLMPARITGREFHQYEVVCPDFSGRPGFPRMQTVPGIYGDVRVSGRFDYTASSRAEYPVPGDWVLVDCEAGALRIKAVLSRTLRIKPHRCRPEDGRTGSCGKS
jgi:hypothetical protein